MDKVGQIREKIDLVSFISEYLPLKKMGRNFTTNCPFHSEKTPSFVVSPERQIWHCFGCQKGGDCFTFLMQYENLEFPEALKILAKKAGIELDQFRFESDISSKKENIYSLNRSALDFYNYILTDHNAGKKALSYLLSQRKIKKEVIKTFSLGFSPKTGNALCNYLIKRKKYKNEDLISAGLAFQKGYQLTDFFKGRLMFPLFDHRDNVIGFSGRILDSSLEISKYINTKETLVYHKGNVFFGLNIAKDAIKKTDRVIVMEGEFDIISSFQEGITNAVAVKGTALTENQAKLISRFTKNISLCLDQDQAGISAIKRSLFVLEKEGLNISVITPNGKDPDEAVKNDPVAFKKTIKEELGIYDFLLSKTISLYDVNKADGKRKITDEILPIFAQIENEIVKEHYLRELSKKLSISLESLIKQMDKIKKENIGIKKEDLKEKRERQEILEEYLLALILQGNKSNNFLEMANIELKDLNFQTPAIKKIMEQLEIDSSNKSMPLELLPIFDLCYLMPLPKFQNDEEYKMEFTKAIKELKNLLLRKKLVSLSSKIKEKEKALLAGKQEDDQELSSLKKEFNSLAPKLQENVNLW